jgi:hypothetical protein
MWNESSVNRKQLKIMIHINVCAIQFHIFSLKSTLSLFSHHILYRRNEVGISWFLVLNLFGSLESMNWK